VSDYSSFILKIRADEGRGVLVGTIQHVGTQHCLHFREMGRMIEFIFEHVAAGDVPPSTPLPRSEERPGTAGERS
jgi:hypothetical protein